MKTTGQLAAICLMIASACLSHAGEIIPITAITGSNGGDQYANGMVSVNNGSGITKADPADPSTWTFNGTAYQDEWMGWYLKVAGVVTPGLNGKLAWASFDLGTRKALGTLHLFNNNYQNGISGVAQYNLYYADSPAVALPAQPAKNTFANTGLTPQGDYDFSSGGWTLFNTSSPLNATKAGINTVELRGVSARYLAVEILTNHGDTYRDGRVGFDEIAVTAGPADTDDDGLPDEYELAHTSPQSNVALNPGDDLEHDGAGDGLTNWQEYLLGTDPNDPDSDDDTLEDGAEVAGAGTRPPTNPLLADSDGDTLSDAIETDSGTFVSTTNPGTSPVNPDTDRDGFKDNVETNTGVFVNAANPGTDPLDADSDDDNATDWYEVAASHTDPNKPGEKPALRYPLPDPDSTPPATDKPVKVYIMSGQSNMVGFGDIPGAGAGTLETIAKQENKFPDLVNDVTGHWNVRNDVLYRGVISAVGNGPLQPKYGANTSVFGPELGFGCVMGYSHDEPVLLIKTSIGNRSLGWDCLPPGSERFEIGANTYAGYGDYDDTWPTADGEPAPFVWYAGKQYDDYFLDEADMGAPDWAGALSYPQNCQVSHGGVVYISKSAHTSSAADEPGVGGGWTTYWNVYSIFNAVDVLDNWATEYAAAGKPFAGQDFEIAGFVWWQGDKDRYNLVHATHYKPNLVNLIDSLRNYYTNRYPGKVVNNAPFVLATLGQTPLDSTDPAESAILKAQLAVDGDAGNYPRYAGNVKTVYAHPLSQGGSSSGHYNHHAGTYMLVGDALGRAMVELLGTTTPTDYDNWAGNYPTADLSDPAADYDRDGFSNDHERIFGLNPTSGASVNPITVPLNAAAGTFSYTRRDDALTKLNFEVWTSTDLSVWTRDAGATQGPADPVNDVEAVSVTLSSTLLSAPKLFVQVRATH